MLELYNTPHSTCSQKVRLCLAEKNLDWTDRHVNLATKENPDPEYLKTSPNGVVPSFNMAFLPRFEGLSDDELHDLAGPIC